VLAFAMLLFVPCRAPVSADSACTAVESVVLRDDMA
jgi:hypothetical protein